MTIGALEPTTVRVSPIWRPRNRANDLICYINVTAFVAVLFVLIVIFLAKDPIICGEPGYSLPKVGSPKSMRGADREDALFVAILRDGKVFLGSDRVEGGQLASKIREGLSKGAEKKIYINADARAKYAWVKEVLDGVQASGVEKVGFLVDQRKTESPTL